MQLGTFVNTIKRILDVLHQRVEDILRQWASCLPVVEDKKSLFGEQMNVITVLLRTKYRNYMQAAVDKLVSNVSCLKPRMICLPSNLSLFLTIFVCVCVWFDVSDAIKQDHKAEEDPRGDKRK